MSAHNQSTSYNTVLWFIFLVIAGSYFFLITQVVNFYDFFLSDSGVKFIQIASLADNQWQTFAIHPPLISLDPEYRFSPLISTPFFYSRNGEVFGIYSNAFALIASLFYGVFGFTGLGVMSILFTVATMWVSYRLSFHFGSKWNWLIPILIGLSTPLLFYTLELYEYPITVFFTTLSLLLIFNALRARQLRLLFGAGLALGATAWFRAESYVFMLAVGLAILIIKEMRRMPAIIALGMGGACIIVPLWILQFFQTGHILGANFVATFNDPTGLVNQWEAINILLPITSERWLFLCVIALLGRIGLCFVPRHLQTLTWLLFMGGISAWIIVNLIIELTHFWLPTHLIRAFPATFVLLLIGGIPSSTFSTARSGWVGVIFLLLICVLHVCGVIVTTSDLGGTGQWGPRYLAPLYPILVIIAFFILQQLLRPETRNSILNRSRFAFVGVLFIVSGIIQIQSVFKIHAMKEQYHSISQIVQQNDPSPVITDQWWFAHVTSASLPDNQNIFLVEYNNNGSLADLLPLLAGHNINNFMLITLADSVESQIVLLDDSGWIEKKRETYPIWDNGTLVTLLTYYLPIS